MIISRRQMLKTLGIGSASLLFPDCLNPPWIQDAQIQLRNNAPKIFADHLKNDITIRVTAPQIVVNDLIKNIPRPGDVISPTIHRSQSPVPDISFIAGDPATRDMIYTAHRLSESLLTVSLCMGENLYSQQAKPRQNECIICEKGLSSHMASKIIMNVSELAYLRGVIGFDLADLKSSVAGKTIRVSLTKVVYDKHFAKEVRKIIPNAQIDDSLVCCVRMPDSYLASHRTFSLISELADNIYPAAKDDAFVFFADSYSPFMKPDEVEITLLYTSTFDQSPPQV